jgi:hypothetical protein
MRGAHAAKSKRRKAVDADLVSLPTQPLEYRHEAVSFPHRSPVALVQLSGVVSLAMSARLRSSAEFGYLRTYQRPRSRGNNPWLIPQAKLGHEPHEDHRRGSPRCTQADGIRPVAGCDRCKRREPSGLKTPGKGFPWPRVLRSTMLEFITASCCRKSPGSSFASRWHSAPAERFRQSLWRRVPEQTGCSPWSRSCKG